MQTPFYEMGASNIINVIKSSNNITHNTLEKLKVKTSGRSVFLQITVWFVQEKKSLVS